MRAIKLVDLVGDKCTGYHEGKKIFDAIDSILSQGLSVEIDMDNITFSSSSFYNAAFGELILKYDVDFLKDRLKFKNMSSKDKFLLSRSISLAKKVKMQAA
jgi:chromosome condensin MukBEF MukE localization factor